MRRMCVTNLSNLIVHLLFLISFYVNITAMNHHNHVLMRAFHNTYFTVQPNSEVQIKQYWKFLEHHQAFLFIRHDIIPKNTDPFAFSYSYCTCSYYCVLTTKQSAVIHVHPIVPEELRDIAQRIVALNGLPKLIFCESPYIAIRDDLDIL